MKKPAILFIIFLILLLTCTITTFAHSGRTDENGGHHDTSTGEYHYHHGWPAHDHINGECPYDFEDNVDHDRNDSSGNLSSTTTTTRNNNRESNNFSNNKSSRLTWWQILLAIVLNAIWVVPFFSSVILPSLTKENLINILHILLAVLLFVAVFSPLVFFFSLLWWWTDGWSRALGFTMAISGGITILAIVVVPIISARRDAKKRANAIIPDFIVWYSPTGDCYHSSKSCSVLQHSKNIRWASDRTNTLSIYNKKPCSKCCYMKDGKVYPQDRFEQESVLPSMVSVVSSNLKEVGYQKGALYVHFHNGSLYRYDNVPQNLAERLMMSPSAGKFFNKHIRNRYDFERLTPP